MEQQIYLIGLNYRTAGVEVRERFALTDHCSKDTWAIPLRPSGENDSAETTLDEGAVSLQRADGSNLIRLHPGQRAIYDTQDEQLEIKEVPVGDHLALSYGIITLDGVPLRQIADRIEELYGVKLRLVDDDAPDANYNFSFQKDTPIEDVIELLQFISGTRFEILRYPDSD